MRLLLLICFVISNSIIAQENTSKRVLFVGNSYTYYWNLPQAVSLMSASLGIAIETKQSTVGGSNLEQHWKAENGSMTRQLIEQGNWDYVVFNNHSLSSLNTPASFYEYGKRFAELVKQRGGKPVFYMTWARSHNKLMLRTISESYRRLADETNAYVVPVGEIWMQSLSMHPEYQLHAADGSHPSPQGTYLTALAFTKFFTGLSVRHVPNALQMSDSYGEKLYITHMQQNEGNFFRNLIDVSQFQLAPQTKEENE